MYLYNKDNSIRYLTIDIETDALKAKKVWCVVVQDILTEEVFRFHGDQLVTTFPEFVARNKDAKWVGHNIISFDAPTLELLLDASFPIDSLVDTLVLSYLWYPQNPRGHSLREWAKVLDPKDTKLDFTDFSQFTPEMLEYCEQDVRLTTKLYKHLSRLMLERGFSELSCAIEHRIRAIIDQQQTNGFAFDLPSAISLRDSLRGQENELLLSIEKVFPPKLVVKATYDYRTKADGTPYASFIRHKQAFPKVQFNRSGSRYRVFDWQPFNLGSPKQRVERLIELGWRPKQFTPKGAPKVDERSLVEYAEASGNEAVGHLAEWLVCNGRANMLTTWIDACGEDSRMHGRVFSCGAGTRRMRHTTPNTANIPSTRAKYGHECRSVWKVFGEDRRLMGCDAKGLEARLLVHYLNHPDAYSYFIDGDPHESNRLAVEPIVGKMSDRDKSKTDFYALIFGAQDPKLGSNYGGGKALGGRIRAALEGTIPGFEEFKASVQREFKENDGWLQTVDGGYVRCPAKHAAVNYKIQSAGGVVMKMGAILLDEEVKKRGLDALKVGDIHDEWQWDVHKDHAEELGELAVDCIRRAGEALGLNAPMDGNYKIGKSWSDTH